MAGTIVAASPLITRLEGQSLGYNGTTLSNFDNSNEPQIIGNLEIAGSIASFASLESITGWAALSNGTVYIKVVPDTTAGTCTAEFTATAPTWDNAKMGWYGTGANANHRYLFKLTKGGASLWSDKRYLPKGSSENAYVENDLTVGNDVDATGLVSGGDIKTGNFVILEYDSGESTSAGQVFNLLAPTVPNTGDIRQISCKSGIGATYTYLERVNSTSVRLRGVTDSGGASIATVVFTSTSTTTFSAPFILTTGIKL